MSSTKLSGLDSSSAGIVLSCTQMLQQAKKCQSWVDRKSEHVKFPLFPMRQSYLLAGPNRGKGVGDLCNMYLWSLYRYTGILWLKNVSLKWDLMTKEFICIIKHKDTASASESTWKFLPEMKVAASWGNGQVKGPSIIALPLLDSFLIIYIWLLSKQDTELDWPSAGPGTSITIYHIQSFISVTHGVLFFSL